MRLKRTTDTLFSQICLALLFSWGTWAPSVYADEKQIGNDIAELSAAMVYNLDDQQMPSVLKPFLKKQTSVMAVVITETIYGALHEGGVHCRVERGTGKLL